MKLKKQLRLLVVIIFWGGLYLLIRSQKFELDKNPYIMGVIFISFIGHILYEGIYKKNKIESKKNETKKNHLDELKSNLTDFTPEIKTDILSDELIEYMPIIKKMGNRQ